MSTWNELQSSVTTAADFPEHYFLENIVIRGDNSMLVTAVMPKTLHYVSPPKAGIAPEPVLLRSFEEHVMGITELEPDVFAIFTANGYTTHESYMHRLDLRGWAPGQKANVELWLTFPKEARALNGCCALSDNTILVADCFAGLIWRVDIGPDGRPQARVWLKHESMAYVEVGLPPPPQPGVNGVRWFAKTRHVYYTTTGQKLFMRLGVDAVTFEPSGTPELIARGGMYDDFCIDEERNVAYLTVHRENRIDLVPLDSAGESPRQIADAPSVVGPSSAAWSRAPDEAGRVIYVTTDGGHTAPPPDGIRNSKVLRLELI
jgi:hypothetical protein